MFIYLASLFFCIIQLLLAEAFCTTTHSAIAYSANFTITSTTSIDSTISSNYVAYYSQCSSKNLVTVSGLSYETVTNTSIHSYYFTSSGSHSLLFLCSGSYSEFTFNILPLKLILTFGKEPRYKFRDFSVIVGIYDNSGTYLESNNGQYKVSLKLFHETGSEVTSSLFGTKEKNCTSGLCVFDSMTIGILGGFTIKAISSNPQIQSFTTKLFGIDTETVFLDLIFESNDNFCYHIIIVTVNIYLYGKISNYNFDVILQEQGGETIYGDKLALGVIGSHNFNIYFTRSGNFVLKIRTNDNYYTNTIPINIKKQEFIVSLTESVIFIQPASTRDTFSLQVSLCNLPENFLKSEPYFANSIDFIITCYNYNEQCVFYDFENKNAHPDGKISVKTVAGTCSFSSTEFIIYTPGLTKLMFKDITGKINPFNTSDFNITDHVKSILLNSSNMNPSIFFDFTITVFMIRYDDKFYLGSSLINIKDDNQNIYAFGEVIGGSKSFNIFIAVTGLLRLYAYYDGQSTSIDLEISALKLIFSFIEYPNDSRNPLIFNIGIYDFEGKYLENSSNNYNGYNISIELIEDGLCSGKVLSKTISQALINGELFENDLYVLSFGTFKLNAKIINIDGVIESESKTFSIKNYVKSIKAQVNNTQPSTNFDIQIDAEFFGDDNFIYIQPLIITLKELENKEISGDTIIKLKKGISSKHIIWFPIYGIYKIQIITNSSNISYILPNIEVKKNKLKISWPENIPETNIDILIFLIEILDESEQVTEIEKGVYEVTINFEINFINYTEKINTSHGKFLLSKNLNEVGNYSISATCLTTSPSNILAFNISEGLFSLDISMNNLTQLENYLFTFEIFLLNKYLEAFMHNIIIKIKCEDDFFKPQNIMSQNGKAEFNLYFTNQNFISCIISNDYTKTTQLLEFNIIASTILDNKCKIAFNSTACYLCVNNATLDNNLECTCIKLSTYNPNDKMCICDPGINYSEGYCYADGNYFTSNEISGYFSEDYKQVMINFARQVNKTDFDCKSVYEIKNLKQNISNYCYWSCNTSMIIEFEKIIYDENLIVEINPTMVQALGNENLQPLSLLNIKIKTQFPLLVPEVSLVAPEIVSIPCMKKNVLVFTRTISDDYIYLWKGTFLSDKKEAFENLNDFFTLQNDYYVIFNKEFFENNRIVDGVLNITLEIKSKIFKTKVVVWRSFYVKNENIVMIEFTAGNSINIKANQPLQLKIQVLENCFDEESDYGDDPLKFTISCQNNENILNKVSIQRPDYLMFPPNSLKPNTSYTFLAKAQGNRKTGYSSINITVDPSDIEISLSRSSGSINKEKDLEITAYAVDPDDNKTSFDYFWNCSEGLLACNDSKNSILVFDSKSHKLHVNKILLRNDAVYLFSLNVYGNNKSQTVTVEITINQQLKGEIIMKSLTSAINNDLAFLLTPQIYIPLKNASYEWKFSPNLPNSTDINYNLSYMYINPGSLQPGLTYKMEFSMNSIYEKGVSVFTFITRNKGAVCKNFTAEYWENDIWVLFGDKCVNPEKESIINYQYGIKDITNHITWITKSVFVTPYYLKTQKPYMFVMKVCDQEKSCNIYETYYVNSTIRILQDDFLVYYEKLIEDPEKIPEIVNYYVCDISDPEILLFFYNKTVDYFENVLTDSAALYSVLESFKVIIGNQDFMLYNQSVQPLVFINKILKNYNYQLDENLTFLTMENFQTILHLKPLESDIDIFLENLIQQVSINRVIGYEIQYINYATFYFKRMYSVDLSWQTFDIDFNNLNFPIFEIEDECDIYDLVYYKYAYNDLTISKILVFHSGTHYFNETFTLFETPMNLEIKFIEPIKIKLYGNYSMTENYNCIQLGINGENIKCYAKVISFSLIEVQTSGLGSFKLSLISLSCNPNFLPIYVLGGLTGIFILLLFISSTKKISKNNSYIEKFKFLKYYPFISMFTIEDLKFRISSVLRIISGQTLLFVLIPILMFIFNTPFDPVIRSKWKLTYEDYSEGIGSLAIVQIYKAFLYIFSYAQGENQIIRVIIISVCILIFITSGIGVIYFSLVFCSSHLEIWLEVFIIMLSVDILVLEFLNFCILKKILPVRENVIIPEVIIKENSFKKSVKSFNSEDACLSRQSTVRLSLEEMKSMPKRTFRLENEYEDIIYN
ncbi:hypothetical protein SteCoe_14863 [Stentor coeruleus]|uniref:GPS domain-containing protein n=1 Tax=Stentor coeruleus TaxID=5963 RepID=A0A1R2C505_9CILI|nr:hypothetical protein SteCoe_14863 [Stentor coeruleus]